MILLIVSSVICIIAVAGLLIYARWNHGIIEKMGLPVVEHNYLMGSTKEIYGTKGGLNDVIWMRKYGKLFGVYEGREAQLFVCVPELVRLICVKDSEYFDSKRPLDFRDPVLNEMPDFQEYEKWKILRSMNSPSFTSAKMKLMNLPIREAIQDFVSGINTNIQSSRNGVHENVAIDAAIHSMLTDVILRSLFSIRIQGSNDVNNEFAKIVHELVTPSTNHHNETLLMWTHTFPFLRRFIKSTIFNGEPIGRFTAAFRQMVKQRRASGIKMNDVVDLCIESLDKLDTPEFKRAKITELTVMCQALVYFFAAQDQVSTLIATMIYHAIYDPEMEKRLFEEVDAVFARHNEKIEGEHLSEFVYLNSCLSESLRMYAFFHRAERLCTKDWTNEEYGLDIKKGMVIQMPIWAINRCEDYNENAETYYPDRFMPENKDRLNPYSSTSFGFGPRNCPGKRFATEVLSLISAYLLKSFKFTASEKTELDFIPGGPFFQPHKPIIVNIEKRSHVAAAS